MWMSGIRINEDNAHKDELRENRWTRESHYIIPFRWTLRVRKAMLYVYIINIYMHLIKYIYMRRIKIKCEMLESINLKGSETLPHWPCSTILGKDKMSPLQIKELSTHTILALLFLAQYSEGHTSSPNGCLCACSQLLYRRGTPRSECLNILQQARNLLAFV